LAKYEVILLGSSDTSSMLISGMSGIM